MQEAFFSVNTSLGRPAVVDFRRRVEQLVTPARFRHIERVAHLAESIAVGNRFDDGERAATVLAAVLHDSARDLPTDELFRLVPPSSQLERSHPLSLHGRAGRRLAEEWGVRDERVLVAVSGHVFGVGLHDRVGMAVYVADVSEPGRGVNEDIRELAICDLEGAYRKAVDSKVRYLRTTGKAVHPETLKVYDEIHNG